MTANTTQNNIPMELLPRNCKTQAYEPFAVPSFHFSADFIAYASPDSTYTVTRDLFENAQRSILIGIYDFTAEPVADLLLAAVQRDVKVTVMVDLDGIKGETALWEKMKQNGIECVPAPSCASRNARYFPSCHEKVIVIDDTWTLIQSGNYTLASIPKNQTGQNFIPGNRDMGIAVRSVPLAVFFAKILCGDIQLELDASISELPDLPELLAEEIFFEAPMPTKIPPRIFPKLAYEPGGPVRVIPVISPENYMKVVPEFLASARQSIFIEQQYIRANQPQIRKLLEEIAGARDRNPKLNVQIILATPFPADIDREKANLQELENFGLKLGTNIRYLNPKYFVHCHNKLIIADRKTVLIGSQNWSETAVLENREAGLLLYVPPLARYYASIFKVDWETGLQSLELSSEAVHRPKGGSMPISRGDYVEV
jgi:phosphatidylserine/phosphatidylglycerophosphate/cardiolipin synthase-like enzyme